MPRKKEAIVVQSNRLIEARYKLSTLEQRLILSMASRVQPEDDDFFKYEIPLRELAELMGIEVTNAYNEIDGKDLRKGIQKIELYPKQRGSLLQLPLP